MAILNAKKRRIFNQVMGFQLGFSCIDHQGWCSLEIQVHSSVAKDHPDLIPTSLAT